jgi:hypothetical protein
MMTDWKPAFSFGLVLSALAPPSALQAQTGNCAPHAIVVERLADRYGESRQTIGLGSNNAVVETFASIETGSWTITVTTPGGLTCLVASGQAFELLAEAAPLRDEGA